MSNDRPRTEPIGLRVQRVAKSLNRAFEDELADAGGSVPTWLILLSLKSGRPETQRELADAVGIRGATMTHHLDALEKAGLVTRMRDPSNRRVQRVALTSEGDAAFHRLRKVAMGFDKRLRAGVSDEELASVSELLSRLAENASAARRPPSAG
jgi:MarR family transcriptional regulator, transcriptional regulator for hemolysin